MQKQFMFIELRNLRVEREDRDGGVALYERTTVCIVSAPSERVHRRFHSLNVDELAGG
jgi:hypothetical protein